MNTTNEMVAKRHWTVWEIRSTDGREVKRVAHSRYPDDWRYVHEYQRIVAQVVAWTPDEALRLATSGIAQ